MDYIPLQDTGPMTAEVRSTNHQLPRLDTPALMVKGAALLAPRTGVAGYAAAGDDYLTAGGAIGHKLQPADNYMLTAAAGVLDTDGSKHTVALAGIATIAHKGDSQQGAYALAGIATDKRDDYSGDYKVLVVGAQRGDESTLGRFTATFQGMYGSADYSGNLRPDYGDSFTAVKGEVSAVRPVASGYITGALGMHYADKDAPRFAQITPSTGRGSAFSPDAFSATRATWLKLEYTHKPVAGVSPFVGVDAVFVGQHGLTGKQVQATPLGPAVSAIPMPARERYTSGYVGVSGDVKGAQWSVLHARDLDKSGSRTLASIKFAF